jgi:hypothetical protein
VDWNPSLKKHFFEFIEGNIGDLELTLLQGILLCDISDQQGNKAELFVSYCFILKNLMYLPNQREQNCNNTVILCSQGISSS